MQVYTSFRICNSSYNEVRCDDANNGWSSLHIATVAFYSDSQVGQQQVRGLPSAERRRDVAGRTRGRRQQRPCLIVASPDRQVSARLARSLPTWSSLTRHRSASTPTAFVEDPSRTAPDTPRSITFFYVLGHIAYKQCIDAAHCYRCRPWSVSVWLSYGHTGELCRLFCMNTLRWGAPHKRALQ